MLKMSYNKLYNAIDYCVENEKDVTIITTGERIRPILDYIECEHGIDELESYEYEDIINDYKIYTLTLYLDNDLKYILEETYLNGTLLYHDCEEFAIYVDNDCNFRDDDLEKRVIGHKIMFELVDEDEEEETTLKDDTEHKCTCAECTCKKDSYTINGKAVSEKEFKKTYDLIEKEMAHFIETLNRFYTTNF